MNLPRKLEPSDALFESLRDWEDVLTLIVDPDSTQVRDAARTKRVLDALLERSGVRYSSVSRGVPKLEITNFDLDRAAKERFRSEPLTIGAAWHHGFWRSYFSHAAITHPANDGLREEFSTAWDILRRSPAILFHESTGTRGHEVRSERLDLPILVGPLPHSDGRTIERAYLDAIRRSDPQRDLRTSTRVIVEVPQYVANVDVYNADLERVLVRFAAERLLPAQAETGEGDWTLVEEIAVASRMLEVAVPADLECATLNETLRILRERYPQLLVSVFLRYGDSFWKQLYFAVQSPAVAMLHVHAGMQKSYRLIPAVDALLKEARMRSRVALVSAGSDSDTVSSASVIYEAILLGANGGSATHLAELALSPRFADVLLGADPQPVLRHVAARDAKENADLASSTLTCWQHSILDFLSCMGIDDIQKTSGNAMAITLTEDWFREVDALATREFGRRNRDLNLARLRDERIPHAERSVFRVSRLLDQVETDLELVASARVLAHRNANYHLMNTNQNLTADHLQVIYRMSGGRFPEADDFFVEGAMGPLSMDGIGVRVSRRSVEASLQNLRRNPAALDYINLCVPRGLDRRGAVLPGARCVLSLDAAGAPPLTEFVADARGGFEVRLSEANTEATHYVVAYEAGGDEKSPLSIALHRVEPADEEENGSSRPAADAPAGLSVRLASADHRIVVRQEAAGGFVLEGVGIREAVYAGPVQHASISLGAAGEDFLLSRVEGNVGLALTSSGEGGPLRLPADVMRWESLQAASAHFGITAADVRAVRDVEIKINQGAKPGKGGRLAAPKVTPTVSRARNIPVGTDALSPDPKHDIYSIEDMPAEVWMWLHYDTYCGIKITGSTYTKYVAAGMWSNFVVDYLLVDAGLGGSGNYHADSSRVGWPDIFRTILHTHDALLREPLYDDKTGKTTCIRDGNGRAFGAHGGTKLLASGGIRGEMDMLKVLIAGADGLLEASIGKAVAFGCNQCGNCHLDCPRGGITTKAELTMQNDRATMRARFRNWTLLNMVKLAVLIDAINRERGWVDDAGHIVDATEVLDDIRKLRGRTDLLEMPRHAAAVPPIEAPKLHELEAALAEAVDRGPHTPAPSAPPQASRRAAWVRDRTPRPPEVEHDSCRVGSLLLNEPVDVEAIWEAARLSTNGGNNRGGGLSFAGFAPDVLRQRTCLMFNTIGPDRADAMKRMTEHLHGLRVFDAQGQAMALDEVRLRLPEFRVPVREEFADEQGWQRAGLRENVGDVTMLFTELRSDVLWRYARRLIASPAWLQRSVKYPSYGDDELLGAVERAVRRDEPFDDEDEAPLLRAFLRDVKEEYYMTLAHIIDTRYYRTGGSGPKFAAKRSGYVVSMGEDLGCIKISGWTHLIPTYFDLAHFWAGYPGARERGGIRRILRGEETWTVELLANVWGMHHRYPTNSPAVDD
jgi:glutamate synthase domain-containing protein 2